MAEASKKLVYELAPTGFGACATNNWHCITIAKYLSPRAGPWDPSKAG
jgi:hypothetical protein